MTNKRILLGISGGIAAYKSAELIRRLRDAGCDVQVVMTQSASEFVTPLTFQALSGRAVRTALFDLDAEAAMGHIELARWADAIVIAPCSTNTLAKLAQGLADDLLSTLCLATDAPIAIAPAMNRLMWANAATQANLDTLKSRGVAIWGPGSGSQACGETGAGRMLEPSELADCVQQLFQHGALASRQVLITAGPTRELIDPVRYISNHSSGKMGYALAAAAAEAGANVTLVSGPVTIPTEGLSRAGVQIVNVEQAVDMYQAVMTHVETADIFIGCAAVADYRLAETHAQKIKKTADSLQLNLVKNPDILAEVAALAKPPFTVGFAAETENVHANAQDKLKRKSTHMIAANQVSEQQGFNRDDNALDVFWPGGHQSLAKTSKTKLARQLIELITQRYQLTISQQHDSKTTS